MARNLITIDEVVNDFILTVGQDDFASDATDTLVRNLALRGLREFGFDMLKIVKSIKLPVNSALRTVNLPDDYVDIVKIGYVGSDGLVYIFGHNKNINYSQVYVNDANGNPIDTDGDGVLSADDCDDTNPDVFPGAPELCDSLDNACDGTTDDPPLTGPRPRKRPTPGGVGRSRGRQPGC